MDEPVTEAAAISLYFLSKLAREHVTVCLSGEGSDEIFAGYDFYRYNLFLEKRLEGGASHQIEGIRKGLVGPAPRGAGQAPC